MTPLDDFIAMSQELCGIPAYYLSGTGCAELYLQTAVEAAGDDRVNRLLALYRQLPTCCQRHRNEKMRARILSSDELGPVARNVVKLWYTATWLEMPSAWHRKFRPEAKNCSFIPKAYAYPESLLGPAVGAHPAGGKPTGYQSWASEPEHIPIATSTLPEQCASAA